MGGGVLLVYVKWAAMNDQPRTTRRRLLATTGSLAALGLAGCVSGAQQTIQSGGGTAPTEEPAQEGEAGHDEDESEAIPPEKQTAEEHHGDPEAHEDDGHGLSGPSEHATVEMITNESGDHFHPHVAWVEVGGTITFENVSGSHSATAYHPDYNKPLRIPEGAAPFDSGLLTEEGATFEHTFETAGVYDVYCAPHEALGMIGSVIVGEPDPHDQRALADPQHDMAEAAATKIESLNHTVNEALGHTHDEETTETERGDHDEEEETGHHGAGEETDSGHHEETETGHHDEETDSEHSH